ncbi:hypothetical protein ABPG75_004377 [Micractinium tetrahymenae]
MPVALRPGRCSLFLMAALSACLAALPSASACTSILVGHDATTDGSVYIARTDDTADSRTTKNKLVYHPASKVPLQFRSNVNKLQMWLPPTGLAYYALPVVLADADEGTNASGETAGINSAGMAISGTETLLNAAATLAVDPYNAASGLTEDSIPSLLLPQAASAREAVQLLGRWVEREDIGAGEGFGVLAADDREAWYFETASGHHWLAQRVPDGSFLVAANQGRFQEVDLSDPANVLHSAGLADFAAGLGHAPAAASDGATWLNFFAAFMADGESDRRFKYPRVCALQALLGGVDPGPCDTVTAAPTFLPPARHPHFLGGGSRRLSLHDVAAGLRNHYDGSKQDPYSTGSNATLRPVAVPRASSGHVCRLRSSLAAPNGTTLAEPMPGGLAAICYVAQGMPALSPFVPVYGGLPAEALPAELAEAPDEPDELSLFWAARRLQAVVLQDWPALAPAAVAAIRALEEDVEARQRPDMEARYLQALRRHSEPEVQAGQVLAEFTEAVVSQAKGLLEELGDQAAQALGLPGLPPDDTLLAWLDDADARFGFHLPPAAAATGGSAAASVGAGMLAPQPCEAGMSGGGAPSCYQAAQQ